MTIPKPGVIFVEIMSDWVGSTSSTKSDSPKSLEDWPRIAHCTRRDSRFTLRAKNETNDLELSFDPANPRDGTYLLPGDRERGRVERVDDLKSDEFKVFCPRALTDCAISFRIVTASDSSGGKRIWFVGLNLDSN